MSFLKTQETQSVLRSNTKPPLPSTIVFNLCNSIASNFRTWLYIGDSVSSDSVKYVLYT